MIHTYYRIVVTKQNQKLIVSYIPDYLDIPNTKVYEISKLKINEYNIKEYMRKR